LFAFKLAIPPPLLASGCAEGGARDEYLQNVQFLSDWLPGTSVRRAPLFLT
jgi:hypothetical protein